MKLSNFYKTLLLFLIATTIIIVFFNWQTSNGSSDTSCHLMSQSQDTCKIDDFLKKIDFFYSQVGDLTSPDDLFTISSFLEIYERPSSSFNCAVKVLSLDSITVEKKKVVIFSMKKLPPQCYTEIVKACYHFFQETGEQESVLKTAILNPFGKNHPFIHSYQSNVHFINIMLNDTSLSNELRNILIKIKSGQLSLELGEEA